MANYVIVGAGRQGLAAGFCLAKEHDTNRITFIDQKEEVAKLATKRLYELTRSLVEWNGTVDYRGYNRDISGYDVCLNAATYNISIELDRLGIEQSVSVCDLGGNSDIVEQQLKLDAEAKAANIVLAPDCGLAPGAGNTLSLFAAKMTENVHMIKVYCGGLPRNPRGKYGYHFPFALEGLLNEYKGSTTILRSGIIIRIPTLSDREMLSIQGVNYEAFATYGGASLAPYHLSRELMNYEYKTLRYPGHLDAILPLNELELAQAYNEYRDIDDLVILHIEAIGDKKVELTFIDRYDPHTRFSSMERMTGFSAAVVMKLIKNNIVKPGAYSPDQLDPIAFYVAFKSDLICDEFRVFC